MSRRWPAGLAALFAVLILASTGLCKPPDLPQYQNVTVLPNAAESVDPALLTAFGFLSSYPIQMLPAEDFLDPSSPCGEEICDDPVPEPITRAPRQEPATTGRCTRVVKPVEPAKPAAPTRSVLENLELLEKASAAVQKAQEMAKEGEIGGAMECLQKAQGLVPGSPCSARINEMLEAMKAVKAQMEAKKKAISTETEAPAKDAPRQPSQETSYHDGLTREITDAYKAACMSETAQATKPCLAPCFPKIVIIVNGAPCAGQGGACCTQGTCPPAVKAQMKVRVRVAVKPSCDPPKAACQAGAPTACGQAAVVAGPCPQKSCCPVAARINQVPLVSALEQLRCATGCQVVIDFEGLRKAGVSPSKPVSLTVECMPLYCALDLMLRPHQLQASVSGEVIRVTCAAECRRTGEKADPNACEEVCPKAAALHARAVKAALAREEAGKKVMVAGLMKACRLALADGRFEKAADLARQAYAVDPAAVEADPMVIKLDLLNQDRPVSAPKPHGPTAAGARPVGAAEEAEEAADGQSKLVPHLPDTFDVVEALEAVGRQAETPRKK